MFANMNEDKEDLRAKRLLLLSKMKNARRSRSLTPDKTTMRETEQREQNVSRNSLGKRGAKAKRECLIPISSYHELQRVPDVINGSASPLIDLQPNFCVNDRENLSTVMALCSSQHAEMKLEVTQNNNNIVSPTQTNDFSVDINCGLVKEEYVDPTVPVEGPIFPFGPGDIVWAFIPSYPLWPALITFDPEDNVYTKTKKVGKKGENRLYHVEFFGDKGSRSWVQGSTIFPFQGSLDALTKNTDFMKHVNPKSKLLPFDLSTAKTSKKNWNLALEEARECMSTAKQERLTFLKAKIQAKFTDKSQSKRKRSMGEADGESKPKAKRRRHVEEVQQSPVDGSVDQDPSVDMEAAPIDDALAKEDTSDEELKEYKKKREKEKRSPEMRVPVCECCGSRNNQYRLLPCEKCCVSYHLECLQIDLQVPNFVCPHCDDSSEAKCCLCKQNGGSNLKFCTFKQCCRRYHQHCIEGFHSPTAKQAKSPAQFICPAHYCHTCVSDLGGELHQPDKKLLRCILCPTAYHTSENCLAAGCIQLSTTQIICFKHVELPTNKTKEKRKSSTSRGVAAKHYNINWCVTCAEGGSLICCERCPLSFHINCLGLDSEPDGTFLCLECLSGKTILYGDIVWVKIGSYRWWPAKVYPMDMVPVRHQKHTVKVGEFLVYFYGSHDSAFVSRGQVFHYHDGDQGCKSGGKIKTMDKAFNHAMELVTPVFHEQQLVLAQRTAERRSKSNVKPPQYNKIRSNRPIGNVRVLEASAESCSRCDCTPEGNKNLCGPDSGCINRMLMVECHPDACSRDCQNQRFRKQQTPPLYPFHAAGKGWGLKSRKDIKKGDFVVEYCGDLIDTNEFQRRLKAKQDAKDESYYFLTLDNTRMIDAGPSGNMARFMNHSCQPNCETQKWTVMGDTRIGLFAIQDVPADTELTFNYQLECAVDVVNESSSQRRQPCNCGAPNCSRFIGEKPKQIKVEIEKASKSLKGKKEKKLKQRNKAKEADDFCFCCTEGGCLVMCDVKDCSKVYHVECLGLSSAPKGHWTCPWHHCDVCGKKSREFCSVCPNSLCATHAAQAEMKTHELLGQICNDHSPEDIAFYCEERRVEVPAISPEPSTSSHSIG